MNEPNISKRVTPQLDDLYKALKTSSKKWPMDPWKKKKWWSMDGNCPRILGPL